MCNLHAELSNNSFALKNLTFKGLGWKHTLTHPTYFQGSRSPTPQDLRPCARLCACLCARRVLRATRNVAPARPVPTSARATASTSWRRTGAWRSARRHATSQAAVSNVWSATPAAPTVPDRPRPTASSADTISSSTTSSTATSPAPPYVPPLRRLCFHPCLSVCLVLHTNIHKTLLKWWQTASQLQYNTY